MSRDPGFPLGFRPVGFGAYEERVHREASRWLAERGDALGFVGHVEQLLAEPRPSEAHRFLQSWLAQGEEFDSPLLLVYRVQHMARQFREDLIRLNASAQIPGFSALPSHARETAQLVELAVECRKLEMLFSRLSPEAARQPFDENSDEE